MEVHEARAVVGTSASTCSSRWRSVADRLLERFEPGRSRCGSGEPAALGRRVSRAHQGHAAPGLGGTAGGEREHRLHLHGLNLGDRVEMLPRLDELDISETSRRLSSIYDIPGQGKWTSRGSERRGHDRDRARAASSSGTSSSSSGGSAGCEPGLGPRPSTSTSSSMTTSSSTARSHHPTSPHARAGLRLVPLAELARASSTLSSASRWPSSAIACRATAASGAGACRSERGRGRAADGAPRAHRH
jgi:hypothetical protein